MAQVRLGWLPSLAAGCVASAVAPVGPLMGRVRLTMIFAAIPELIAALIAGGGVAPAPAGTWPAGPGFAGLVSVNSGKLALGLFVGALACSVIYNAVFVMVSVATTRAIAVGLLYVLVWETLLSNFVSGVKLLSVSHYGLGIANGFANDSALQAGLTVATSVIMGVIVTGVALAVAVNLLSSFTLKGEPA